jgi:hypothetical protein
MSLCRSLIVLWSFSLFTFGCAKNDAPSAEEFKQVLGERLQELKPAGFTVRTVRFEEVRLGEATRGNFPFEVTATVHDYGPGYPANRTYGQTCVGKMDKWKFDMRRDEFGRWFVQGRMTVSDRVCKDNPSEGVSALPLPKVAGEPGSKAVKKDRKPRAKASKGSSTLSLGEYACYGYGNQLMAGMGFRLAQDGTYKDVDGGRGGTYVTSAADSTISFRGGFLDGQVGRNIKNSTFDLSATVNCEPWK